MLLIFKSLADPVRIRTLQILSNGEQCVCNLVEILDLPQSTISRQLGILKNAGLINIRKEGLWHYYSLNKKDKINNEVFLFLEGQWKVEAIFAHDLERMNKGLTCSPPS